MELLARHQIRCHLIDYYLEFFQWQILIIRIKFWSFYCSLLHYLALGEGHETDKYFQNGAMHENHNKIESLLFKTATLFSDVDNTSNKSDVAGVSLYMYIKNKTLMPIHINVCTHVTNISGINLKRKRKNMNKI